MIALLEKYIDELFVIRIEWDTQKDSFECFHFHTVKKTKKKLPVALKDVLIDLTLDSLDLMSQEGEFSNGFALLTIEEQKYVLSYENTFKKRYESSETIELKTLVHPEAIKPYLIRSDINFNIVHTHQNFIRIDIKPMIYEGDAYTLKTDLQEKYRNYFSTLIKEMYDSIFKKPAALEFSLQLSSIIKTITDVTFIQTNVWYEMQTDIGKTQIERLIPL